MRLKRLYVHHLRNLEEVEVEFSPGITEIVGENAQGKTSLLEAISLCLTGTSFRAPHLKECITHSQKGFFIEAHFEKDAVSHQIALSYDGTVRRVFFNKTPCSVASALLGLLAGVTSTPEDVHLIKGAPSCRRHFLDLQIAQSDPLYVHHLSRYIKALKQRNALLKQKQEETIVFWEEQLAQSGAYLAWKRQKTCLFISTKLPPFFSLLSKDETPLELIYTSPARDIADLDSIHSYFIHEYAKRRQHEMFVGATLVGPHRDDFHLLFHKRPFRECASEGQKHLATIALKLAEWHYLQHEIQDLPLMILDDFGMSLDGVRKKLLFEELLQLGQVFLSSHTSIGNNVLFIEGGKIKKIV